jgi:hypothetical protein
MVESVCTVPGGAGAGDPLVEISPALADIAKAQVNVSAIKKRFIK